MQRFFIPPFDGNIAELPEEIARQLFSVLRMRGGEEIILLDNAGWEYTAKIIKINRKIAQAEVIERRPAPSEPNIKISIYQCLLKKENFEWVLQKGTEIGVTEFIPVISQRTISDIARSAKFQRWERILTEASEQSRRGKIPMLQPVQNFDEALAQMQEADLKIIPWEEEQSHTLTSEMKAVKKIRSVAIMVGPEGGFSAEEAEFARQQGIQPITFGQRILRAETAAIYAASVLNFLLNPVNGE